ncbi:MAG: GxxExxY protein [Planctomycetota bacterium]
MNRRRTAKEKGETGKLEKTSLEKLIREVIGCCIRVHMALGPGFLEAINHRALEIELAESGIDFETENEIALTYRGHHLGTHRLDLLVHGRLVVELKTVEELTGQHYAQVRSYLKATGTSLGLLANFAERTLDPRRVELKAR